MECAKRVGAAISSITSAADPETEAVVEAVMGAKTRLGNILLVKTRLGVSVKAFMLTHNVYLNARTHYRMIYALIIFRFDPQHIQDWFNARKRAAKKKRNPCYMFDFMLVKINL